MRLITLHGLATASMDNDIAGDDGDVSNGISVLLRWWRQRRDEHHHLHYRQPDAAGLHDYEGAVPIAHSDWLPRLPSSNLETDQSADQQ